ncbi:MAG: hypothetical protein RL701_7647 [Pseudomonadota bacterium]
MSELQERVRGALEQISDDWSAERSERTLPGVHKRLQARMRRRRAMVGAAGLALVIAVGWGSAALRNDVRAPQAVLPPSAAEPAKHMQFEDGSHVDLLDASARIVVDEVTRERVSVRLLSGRARVEVTPRKDKERTFRVQCGDVTVEVLGTAFELLREGERTRVSVLRGRVAVHAPEGVAVLAAGEVGWYPKPVEPPALQPIAAEPVVRPASKKSEHREVGWQAQAERGDYKRAYELMPGSPERVSDDLQELLLAADSARLSGHPAQALPFLRRAVERHPRDPRAALAAFTLGGVLLNQLDRPREAEAAYARARKLSLSPALAQDALARQVEAAHRAGDGERTRELASDYLRLYPKGRRVQWVKELLGS